MNPLVTCVCLTRNRREWLPKAIDCFMRQTYENRELLILADGDPVRDLIPAEASGMIRCSQMPEVLDIGSKRNSGIIMAQGLIIAHFDDDDFSAARRLEDQVGRLQTTGKTVTAYHSMKFTDGKSWWLYQGTPAIGLGTSLCYRRDWAMNHLFPQRNVGEDLSFVNQALDEGQFISVPAGDLMYATVHAGNTCPREINKSQYKKIPAPKFVEARV